MDPEPFWTQVGAYNEATFPFQAILVVTAVFLTSLTFVQPTMKTDTWMKAFLALAFDWHTV